MENQIETNIIEVNKGCIVINVLPSEDQFPNRYNFSENGVMPNVVIIIIHPNGHGIAKLLKPENEKSQLLLAIIKLDNSGKFVVESDNENTFHLDHAKNVYEKPGWIIYSESQIHKYHVNDEHWEFCCYHSGTNNTYSETFVKEHSTLPICQTYNNSGVCEPFIIEDKYLCIVDWEKMAKLPLTELCVKKYFDFLKPHFHNLNSRFLRKKFIEEITKN